MGKIKNNQTGFGAVEAILIVVIVILLGVVGWMVYKNQNNKANTTNKSATSNSKVSTTPKTAAANTAETTSQNSSTSYLVVKEWGVRFKIPSGLSDVQYQITKYNAPNGDGRLGIYAKPTGSNVQYRSDYKALNPNGYPFYSVGNLYQSTYATQDRPDSTVSGKKLGDYYYYTDWAFSAMATGAACVALYGDSTEANCEAASTVFQLVNQGDTALLNTIELAQ